MSYENHLMKQAREQRESVRRAQRGITSGPATALPNMTEKVAEWKALKPSRPEPPDNVAEDSVLVEWIRATEQFKFTPGKKTDLASATISGWASRIDSVVDTVPVKTRIAKGAFARTLDQRGDRIKILWSHDSHQIIGAPLELVEKPQGLWLRASLNRTDAALEVVTGLQHAESLGRLSSWSFSIGFTPVSEEIVFDKERDEHIRVVKELMLFEVSVVGDGADEGARVSLLQVHSAGWASKREMLDLWKQEPNTAQAIAELEAMAPKPKRRRQTEAEEFDEIIAAIPAEEFWGGIGGVY